MIWLVLLAVSYVIKRIAHHYFTLQMMISERDCARYVVADTLIQSACTTLNEGRPGRIWLASLIYFGEGPPLHVRISHGLEDFAERVAKGMYGKN